ncbi:hypothetical protein HK096_003885 [Nowakowskiella sp. JEL0078]|nr:hypothetical protein HK096_003885 [Nowakowskiella sp. JEL0078]
MSRTIIVGLDSYNANALKSNPVLRWAALEHLRPTDRVIFVHASKSLEIGGKDIAADKLSQETLRETEKLLENAARIQLTTYFEHISGVPYTHNILLEVKIFKGDPRQVLLDLAAEHNATIIVGSRGVGAVKRALLGSVSEHLVRNSISSVIVIPFYRIYKFSFQHKQIFIPNNQSSVFLNMTALLHDHNSEAKSNTKIDESVVIEKLNFLSNSHNQDSQLSAVHYFIENESLYQSHESTISDDFHITPREALQMTLILRNHNIRILHAFVILVSCLVNKNPQRLAVLTEKSILVHILNFVDSDYTSPLGQHEEDMSRDMKEVKEVKEMIQGQPLFKNFKLAVLRLFRHVAECSKEALDFVVESGALVWIISEIRVGCGLEDACAILRLVCFRPELRYSLVFGDFCVVDILVKVCSSLLSQNLGVIDGVNMSNVFFDVTKVIRKLSSGNSEWQNRFCTNGLVDLFLGCFTNFANNPNILREVSLSLSSIIPPNTHPIQIVNAIDALVIHAFSPTPPTQREPFLRAMRNILSLQSSRATSHFLRLTNIKAHLRELVLTATNLTITATKPAEHCACILRCLATHSKSRTVIAKIAFPMLAETLVANLISAISPSVVAAWNHQVLSLMCNLCMTDAVAQSVSSQSLVTALITVLIKPNVDEPMMLDVLGVLRNMCVDGDVARWILAGGVCPLLRVGILDLRSSVRKAMLVLVRNLCCHNEEALKEFLEVDGFYEFVTMNITGQDEECKKWSVDMKL